MGVRLRLSQQTLAVLDALLAHPGQWHHGYSLSQRTGISSGTLYPILMRLEKLRWLETQWEDARVPGRPQPHLYRLSGTAREWARAELRAAEQQHFWKPAERKHEPILSGISMPVRFARWLLACAVRHWPEESRAWGMAVVAETSSALEALRWSWGGLMLFARTIIASVLTWMKLPAGASRPDKAELSNTPILPRRSRLFTAGVLTAGVVMLLLPMGRQAMTMVRDSWSGFQPSASERGELDKLATRAEEQEHAATLAFVALRLDDPARYAVLAGWLALQAVLDWSRFCCWRSFHLGLEVAELRGGDRCVGSRTMLPLYSWPLASFFS